MRYFDKLSTKDLKFKARWLKKTIVLLSLPLLAGTFVMKLLVWAEKPGFSDASLEIVSTSSPSTSIAISQNETPNAYMASVRNRMEAPGFVFLLGCQMAIHDLGSSKPFHSTKKLREKYSPEILNYASRSMSEMVRNLKLQPQDPMLDSLLSEILISLKYDYISLQNYLFINELPERSRIRIVAQTDHPDLSTYMVNTFSTLFIGYNNAVDNEQGESSWYSLKKMVDQKRDLWEKSRENLRIKQTALQLGESGEVRKKLLQNISLLEADKQKLKSRIKEIKSRLYKKSKTRAVPVVDQDSDKEEKLLIELADSQANLRLVEAELEKQKKHLEEQDEQILNPLREKEERLRKDYLLAREKFESERQSGGSAQFKLAQVEFGQTRYPNPFAIWVLAGLSFTAAFFLWILFLFRIGYLRG